MWVGCGECDVAFRCHDGVQRCIRLQPVPRAPGALFMWVVYDHPSDHPDHFVARQWVIGASGERATSNVMVSKLLTELQAKLASRGFTQVYRDPADDPKIVEVWL